MNSLTEKIIEKGFVTGPFMKSSDPAMVEIAGYAGFDFIILDMEHGPVSLQQMQNMVRAADVTGITPVIRTRDRYAESISQALDIGAQTIQIPQLTTAAEAMEAVKAAKFFPSGNRGVCRFVRAAHYSAINKQRYFNLANQTEVIIQVEGVQALDNFEEILNVPGIDILFIGPYDLSQSMGVPGEINHPDVTDAMKRLIDQANKAGKYIGIFADTIEDARMWRDAGVHYLSYSVDMGLFLSACQQIVTEIHSSI